MEITFGNSLSVIVMGPAGSGKTTLVYKFGRWLEKEYNYKVAYINLDPAVEYIPYKPDFDARSIVSARDLMVREGLGPNGAIVRAVDILAKNSVRILRGIKKLKYDIALVDTPGQTELFLFREAGPILTEAIARLSKPVGIYLVDPILSREGEGFAIAYLMTLVIRLRLGIESIPVVNKIDVSTYTPRETYVMELDKIREKLEDESGLLSEVIYKFADILRNYSPAIRVVAISALKENGFNELFTLIHEVFCTCGDLT